MSFLLDPFALLAIGFIAGKIYSLSMAFGDSFFRRGMLKRGLIVAGILATLIFWTYSSLLYVDVIYFPWPLPKLAGGNDWMLNSGLPLDLTRTTASDLVGVVIFATYPLWFYLGAQLGIAGINLRKERRLKERDRIVTEVVNASFPKGGAIPPSADEVNAPQTVIELFGKIPTLFANALTLILFAFDSRLLVFVLVRKWSRFVELDSDRTSTREKRKYMEVWESTPFLFNVIQIFKLISSFGYYTKAPVWKVIHYHGPFRPKDPPWYNAGPSYTKS